MDTLCEMLADWNIPVGELMKGSSSQRCHRMVWPEAVAYQISLKVSNGSCMKTVLYNLTVSPVKGFKGDKLASTVACLVCTKVSVVWNKGA